MDKSQKKHELIIAYKELAFQNEEKEKRAAELVIANEELVLQNEEKEKRAAELIIANKELAFQNEEKEKRAAELIIANKELAFQNEEKEKRAAELTIANKELAFQNEEKEKRAAELTIANKELAFQNKEKEKRAAELGIANIELAFQNDEKEKRADELIIANTELAFQNEEKERRAAEKEKRAEELIIANKELAFQNKEKEKRAAELGIANIELAFQNKEKEKRAAELIVANKELAFQNKEKEKRATEKEKKAEELIVANKELAFQNKEKEKRAAELGIASIELAFQNDEKEKRAEELIIANKELAFQNIEKEKRAAELGVANYARSLIEASLDPLVTINAEGKITDVNEASVKVTGVHREKLIDTDFSDYFTEPKKAQDGYLQVFEKGFVSDYPLTIKHMNGNLTDVLYNASVYKDDKGNVLGVFAAARDVTVQKWAIDLRIANKELVFQNEEKEKRAAELIIANKELNQSEKLLKGSLKEISDYKDALDATTIIALTDQKGIIRKANSNFCKISKYSEDELIGQDHRIINSGYHPKEFIRGLWETIAAGKIWKGEVRNKAKDGTFYWVDTTIVPFLNEHGKPYQYLAIRVDISKRKESEEQLKTVNKELLFQNNEKEKRAAELVIANKELAFQNDEKENRAAELLIANKELAFQHKEKEKRAAELTVANKELAFQNEEKGKRAAELTIANKELAFQNEEKGKRSAELTIANKELAFQNEEKGKRAAELTIANKELAFQNEEKEKRAAELVIVNRELQLAEAGIRKLNEELEQKVIDRTAQLESANKELESFSYSVSHDLRAPIRAINGYAAILEEDHSGKFDVDGKNALHSIIHNSKKMGNLIDDLLAFSKLGRKQVTVSEINMTTLVKAVSDELVLTGDENKIKFNMDTLPPAKGDPSLIKQVWINLISNAIKYSKNKPISNIEIGAAKKGNLIVYYVKDNGAGFDMRYYDKLFGIFQRLHSQEEFEGTGIGLAIVQKIVQRHNGTVWAESKPDEETIFYFSLPAINY
jgi:PAS domain S-box-containing protein